MFSFPEFPHSRSVWNSSGGERERGMAVLNGSGFPDAFQHWCTSFCAPERSLKGLRKIACFNFLFCHTLWLCREYANMIWALNWKQGKGKKRQPGWGEGRGRRTRRERGLQAESQSRSSLGAPRACPGVPPPLPPEAAALLHGALFPMCAGAGPPQPLLFTA